MNAHEFINYELEFDLKSSYIAIVEENIGMLDGRDEAVADNEPIEEVDNVQIGDYVIDRVGCKDVQSALVTLKQFPERRLTDVTPLIQSIRRLEKERRSRHPQESHMGGSLLEF